MFPFTVSFLYYKVSLSSTRLILNTLVCFFSENNVFKNKIYGTLYVYRKDKMNYLVFRIPMFTRSRSCQVEANLCAIHRPPGAFAFPMEKNCHTMLLLIPSIQTFPFVVPKLDVMQLDPISSTFTKRLWNRKKNISPKVMIRCTT